MWIYLATCGHVAGRMAFVRPRVQLITAECLPYTLIVDGGRQQESQVQGGNKMSELLLLRYN